MRVLLNDREVYGIIVEGKDWTDYPDFCDAYIASAIWADTGECLTDDEIDLLNEVHDDLASELCMMP